MRILGFLSKHKIAVLIIIGLLFGQAACDLAIPTLTSQIVDVGIQQSGVEHVAVDVMTATTHDELENDLTGSDQALFDRSYDLQQSGVYELNDFGKENIDELDSILSEPLIKIHSTSDDGSSSAPDSMASLDSDSEDSLLHQKAISASIAEYEAAGYDLSGMRSSFLLRVGVLMCLLALLQALISILVGFIASRTSAFIGRDLRKQLFSNVVAFSEKEISEFSAASLITRGTNDIQQIQGVSTMLLRMVLYAPILAIGGMIMVMVTNASMGWIVVVAVLVVFAVMAVLFKLTLPRFQIMQKLIDKVNLISREILTGTPVIRAFNRQSFDEHRFDVASLDLMGTQLFTNRAMSFMMPTMMLVMNLTSVAIVWFGGLGVNEGTIQTGELIAFITYAMVIIMGFLMVGMIAIMLPRANVAAERVSAVINTVPSITDPKEPAHIEEAPSRGCSVEFDKVTFRYGEEGECDDVLNNVSFSIEPGQTLAIVGATGSGKSTVLKLLERFYDVDEGSVRVNGIDVRDMTQADLRSMLGYVPQKSFLFSGTVRSNVAFSDQGMSDSTVEQALEISQAKDFVSEMSDGVDTEIDQGGTNVSGGQRQRLCIARALATDAGALLFDDSFSALDYKTESILRSALATEEGYRTRIVVAQRISTARSADKIIVLDEGKVAGQGTHEELMRTCEVYQQIAATQLSEFELALKGEEE